MRPRIARFPCAPFRWIENVLGAKVAADVLA
jgi:hypothetical protein